jgi:CheY-like chemotaxis protein
LPFDILLLDLALPDAFGSEIIRELALDPRASGLKIVIITGHLAPGEEETFLSQLEPKARALVASILIKPYEWNSLSATIAQVTAVKNLPNNLIRILHVEDDTNFSQTELPPQESGGGPVC